MTIFNFTSIINKSKKEGKIKMNHILAKNWKKIGMLILIFACVFNVMAKLMNKVSFNKEILSSAQYMFDKTLDNTEKNTNKTK